MQRLCPQQGDGRGARSRYEREKRTPGRQGSQTPGQTTAAKVKGGQGNLDER